MLVTLEGAMTRLPVIANVPGDDPGEMVPWLVSVRGAPPRLTVPIPWIVPVLVRFRLPVLRAAPLESRITPAFPLKPVIDNDRWTFKVPLLTNAASSVFAVEVPLLLMLAVAALVSVPAETMSVAPPPLLA